MKNSKVEKKNIVMWSVLGTSSYAKVRYKFNEDNNQDDYYEDYYVQRVIYQYLKKIYGQVTLKIFLTRNAEESNWIQRFENSTKFEDGLKKRLEEDKAEYKVIYIEDGSNETEIWKNFNIFYDEIEESDVIFTDITHSFRSIPVILLSVLGMAKRTKKIEVGQIYYGTYNKDNEYGETIISLGIYDQITEWSNSISRFLETGYAKIMVGMTNKHFGSIFMKINKDSKEETDFLKKIKKLNTNINTFSENLLSVRGMEIVKNAKVINNTIRELKYYSDFEFNDNNILAPFYKIIGKIEELFINISDEKSDIENTNEIIYLCIRFSLLQQGITFFEENLTSYLIAHTNSHNIDYRWKFNFLLNGAFKAASGVVDTSNKTNHRLKHNNVSIETLYAEKFHEKLRELENNKGKKNCTFSKKGYESIEFEIFDDNKLIYDIGSLKRDIQYIRNDINHAGFKNSASDMNTMLSKLKDFIKRFENLIQYEETLGKEQKKIKYLLDVEK